MGYFSDKSDLVRLLSKDLREEHGEEADGALPWIIGIPVGIWVTWFLFSLL